MGSGGKKHLSYERPWRQAMSRKKSIPDGYRDSMSHPLPTEGANSDIRRVDSREKAVSVAGSPTAPSLSKRLQQSSLRKRNPSMYPGSTGGKSEHGLLPGSFTLDTKTPRKKDYLKEFRL